ncbi:hypothetical protein ANN_01578 [Periplaneta americana]|uniref:Uncharacterized protein n=1 Tax=Periplaneta americana TaxID=6978 RepID=A0ABQ8TVK7_PERAM|nr:hypothetical protein ANN_01578 [Periplaneta americana]
MVVRWYLFSEMRPRIRHGVTCHSPGIRINIESVNHLKTGQDPTSNTNKVSLMRQVQRSARVRLVIYKTVILPVIHYGCETWTLILREEQRLRVFENNVLRKIFGAKRDEVTGECRKLHNTELHALYSSPDIIRNIKFRRLRWAGHVARMGESRNAYRKKESAGSLAEKKLPTEGCTGRNGEREKSSGQNNISDDNDIKNMDHLRRLRGRKTIGKIGGCWVCSRRPALGQSTMNE